MTRKQRIKLAELCKFGTAGLGRAYEFRPINSKATIQIAIDERTDSNTRKGNYLLIDCRDNPLPEDIEEKLDIMLINRAYETIRMARKDSDVVSEILRGLKND